MPAGNVRVAFARLFFSGRKRFTAGRISVCAGNEFGNGFRRRLTLTFLTFLHFWRGVHGL